MAWKRAKLLSWVAAIAIGGCVGELPGEEPAPGRLEHEPALLPESPLLFGPAAAARVSLVVDGSELIAVREHLVAHRDAQTWVGHVSGARLEPVVFTRVRDTVVGSVRRDGRLVHLVRGPDGILHTRVFEAPVELRDAEPLMPPGAPALGAADAEPIGEPIDIGFVGESAAVEALGGPDAFEALMHNELAILNRIMIDAGVATQFRLAGTRQIAYSLAAEMETDLNRLRDPGDGIMDGVHDWRNEVGADVLHLVVRNQSNACGIAYFAYDGRSEYAVGMSALQCFGKYTLQHEIGHNLGFAHAPEDGGYDGAFPYARGHKDASGGFRTLMAYECSGVVCPRIARLSSGSQTYEGHPLGNGNRDNARAVAQTWATLAQYRPAVPRAAFWVQPAEGDQSVCADRPVAVRATPYAGASYSWRVDGVDMATGPVLDWVPGEGVHTIELTMSGAGITDVASAQVAATALPRLATTTQGMCRGESIELTTEGAASVEWSPAELVSAPGAVSTTAAPAETTTFVAHMRSPEGCVSEESVVIEVGERPPAPALVGPAVVTAGIPVVYEADTTYQVRWDVGDGTLLSSDGGQARVVWPSGGARGVAAVAYEVAGCEVAAETSVEVVEVHSISGGCSAGRHPVGSLVAGTLLALLAVARRRRRA